MASPPKSRNEFEISIVCALDCEYNAALLIFDETWGQNLGQAAGDSNHYKTGRIGHFNVVLLNLHGMGKVAAASATASLRSSFPEVKIAFVTGICGGIPTAKLFSSFDDLLLGDVIIGSTIIQYDFGREGVNGFTMKDGVDELLGRGVKPIENLVGRLKSNDKEDVEEKANSYLMEIQKKQAGARKKYHRTWYDYPGFAADKLYRADYIHKHRNGVCETCSKGPNDVCQEALTSSCEDLGCDDKFLVPRDRLESKQDETSEEAQAPEIWVGKIGSGDTVMKSGFQRDKLAKLHDLLAFEMEGAGVFSEIPCIVVKAVCDYADSHKHKRWQLFASATAAAVTRSLIDLYPKTDRTPAGSPAQNSPTEQSPTQSKFAQQGPRVVFNGTVNGKNMVAGNSYSGGQHTFNFS